MALSDRHLHSGAPGGPAGIAGPGAGDAVRFLSTPGSYPHDPARVEVRETHMSWVFLTGSLVYKLKKPLRRPFLDLSSIERRRRNCEAELRLNRRLAPDTYLRVLPLCRVEHGALSLAGRGEIVDWLVEMRQLPAGNMLDERLRLGRVELSEIVAVARRLAAFYRAEPPRVSDGAAYLAHIRNESRINRRLLLDPRFGLEPAATAAIVDRVEATMARSTPMIRKRIAAGHIIEGHGDLRPEHVCLGHPPRIIDCLEFDRRMRLLDPFDEVNYLGLECAFLGFDWIGPLLLDVLGGAIGHRPDARLVAAYGAFRSTLRARICIAHLLDSDPREPQRWPDEARRYLSMADEACVRAEG